jgi:hypothetical protein
MTWQTDDHPVATTKRTGATRNTGASGPVALSIPAGSVQFSGNTPQVSLGRSDVPVNYVPPDLQRFTTSGTYVRPTWMVAGDILEIYIHPAGGGGQSGGYGAAGEGGLAGTAVGRSYVLGSDPKGTGFPIIPLSTTTFTHTLGAPGSGGVDPYTFDPGFNAGATSVSAAGITTLTGAGGLGGGRAGNNSNVTTGGGAADVTLDSHTEYGGTPAGVNQDGVFPGGGGGSGYPAFGRAGAAARVAYRARQAA